MGPYAPETQHSAHLAARPAPPPSVHGPQVDDVAGPHRLVGAFGRTDHQAAIGVDGFGRSGEGAPARELRAHVPAEVAQPAA